MGKYFTLLRQRLKARPDSEHEQAIIRIVINIICILYFSSLLLSNNISPGKILALQAIWAYFAIAIAIFCHIAYRPAVSPVRRGVGIVGDMSIISFALYMTGPAAFVSFPLYLWVTIGNGLRFGQKYLFAAMIAAAVGFSITFTYSSYLHQQFYVGIGILLSIIALPIYFSILINRLNISNRKLNKLLEKTSIMATHDNLTGLANRNLFYDRTSQALSKYERDKEEFFVFFIDLDGFKPINDKMGHAIGDKLLQEVANRIEKNIRSYDTASRFGGDEFVLLISNIRLPSAGRLAEKIIKKISETYHIEGNHLRLTASIGIASVEDGEKNISAIIKNADSAMYQAKTMGKNRWCSRAALCTTQLENQDLPNSVSKLKARTQEL